MHLLSFTVWVYVRGTECWDLYWKQEINSNQPANKIGDLFNLILLSWNIHWAHFCFILTTIQKTRGQL